MRRRDFIRAVGGAGLVLATSAQAADDYPARPIRIVVPYPPGGGTDIVGRILGRDGRIADPAGRAPAWN